MSEHNSFWDGGAKTMFFTGLFLGIAATLALVFAFMFSSLMKGGFAMGAQANVVPPANTAGNGTAQAPTPSKPVAAVDPAKDHIRGPANAKVTMIEYSDFQCPYCERHEPTIEQVLKDHPNDVRLVYRHYPLSSLHPEAQKAAEASECAFNQGGNDVFWKAHDYLFAHQDTLGTALYTQMAKDLKLDVNKFTSCLSSGATAATVAADEASGNDAGVSGTPSTFVNGQMVEGAVPADQFSSIITSALSS
ncbi:MAG TPA: DsbA family protein [Verrucomicrobiae bacterium]|nr:DsbA family protein [Verrucomicrobiae bacterium]